LHSLAGKFSFLWLRGLSKFGQTMLIGPTPADEISIAEGIALGIARLTDVAPVG
jgi:hypothetical protein